MKAARRPGEATPRPAHVSVALLGAAAFIVTANVWLINPLLPVIAGEFGQSVGRAALIVSAYALPYGVCQLIYGPLGDRLGKLRVMTAALAVFALGTAACAFAPNLPALAALRMLTGAAAAALIPLSMAYIGDHFAYGERQVALGQFLALLGLGQVLGASLGGVFGGYLSWRAVFLLSGVVAVGVWLALWRGARAYPAPPRPPRVAGDHPFLRLLRAPAARLVLAAVFVEGVFLFSGVAFLGSFLRERHGLPYLAIGFMLAGFGVGGMLYSRIVGPLVRRIGEGGLIQTGGVLCGACFAALALAGHWWPFVPLGVVLGAGNNLLHGTLQTRATELAPGARGAAVSLFAFCLFLGQGIGAALLGAIVNGPGYAPMLLLCGVTTTLLALWIAWASRRLAGRL